MNFCNYSYNVLHIVILSEVGGIKDYRYASTMLNINVLIFIRNYVMHTDYFGDYCICIAITDSISFLLVGLLM